jgi:hypothetical protein
MPSYVGGAPPQTAYPYPYIPGPPMIEPKTSPMAIWALVLVILLGALGALVGIPLAFAARSKIRQSGGILKGSGLALAALIIGFAYVAFLVLAIAIPTFLGVTHSGPSQPDLNYSVQGQITGTASNDFSDHRVSSVVCTPPSQWTTGSTFTCIAYATAPTGLPASEVGRYYGTVAPNASDGTYQWNGRYFPAT